MNMQNEVTAAEQVHQHATGEGFHTCYDRQIADVRTEDWCTQSCFTADHATTKRD